MLQNKTPKLLYSLSRSIKLGLINIYRNKLLSIASIGVMAMMICIFNVILAVNAITQQALNDINQRVDIILYLKDDSDFYEVNSFKEEITQMPGVNNVEFISKSQALDIISESYPETADFLVRYNLQNPLPASLSITTYTAEDQRAVLKKINNSKYSNLIDNSNNNSEQQIIQSAADNLVNINNFVKQLIFWIIFIFILGGSLVIINAIQLTIFNRKNEIFVMRLVGATPGFIRMPFLTEGIVYAIAASILSYIFLYLVSSYLQLNQVIFEELISSINIFNYIILQIAATVLLAILSTNISIEKYLKGKLE